MAAKLRAKLIRQPNADNSVGFLRNECKNNLSHTPFENQLLHTISHIADLYEMFDGHNIVMDRSYISTCVYAGVLGLTSHQQQLLYLIHNHLYVPHIHRMKYDVEIVVFDAPNRYDENKTDKFETTFEWHKVRDAYNQLCKDYINLYRPFFHPSEKFAKVVVDPRLCIEDMHAVLASKLGVSSELS